MSHLIRIGDIKHASLKEASVYASLFVDMGSDKDNIFIETEIMENLDELKRVYDEIIGAISKQGDYVNINYTLKI